MQDTTKIDRDEEDENIIKFQKTGNLKLLDKVYADRVPTLNFWAEKYHYLHDSKEDMFSELTHVFLKTVEGYSNKRKIKKGRKTIFKKTPFNTYLFYSFDNFVKNIMNSKRAKKRKPFNADPNSISNYILSLEYSYKDKCGQDITLQDTLSDPASEHEDKRTEARETMEVLINHTNPILKPVLEKLTNGETLSSALKDYKIKTGVIKLGCHGIKKLKDKRDVKKIIGDHLSKSSRPNKKFKMIDYKLGSYNKLFYTVEVGYSREAMKCLKEIKELRKNKDSIMKKIKGE